MLEMPLMVMGSGITGGRLSDEGQLAAVLEFEAASNISNDTRLANVAAADASCAQPRLRRETLPPLGDARLA